MDSELTFLTCGSDVASLERFKKNVEDFGLKRTTSFILQGTNIVAILLGIPYVIPKKV